MDSTHVDELKTKILDGEFGQTTMSAPSVLVNQNDIPMQSTCDGKFILDNGKHWIKALTDVREVYLEIKGTLEKAAAASPPAAAAASPPAEIEEDNWPGWLVPPLRRVFEDGILVDYHRYPHDDRLAQAAVQCLSHEQEMNKYRVSTVADRVNIVRKAHAATNDWGKTKKTLVDLFGLSKASTVQRWCMLEKGGWMARGGSQ